MGICYLQRLRVERKECNIAIISDELQNIHVTKYKIQYKQHYGTTFLKHTQVSFYENIPISRSLGRHAGFIRGFATSIAVAIVTRAIIVCGTRSKTGASVRFNKGGTGGRLVAILEAGEVSRAPPLAERAALLALSLAASIVRSTRLRAARERSAAARLTGRLLFRAGRAQVSEGLADGSQRSLQSVASVHACGRVAHTLREAHPVVGETGTGVLYSDIAAKTHRWRVGRFGCGGLTGSKIRYMRI